MKKIFSLLLFSFVLCSAYAQKAYLCKDGSYTTVSIEEGMNIDLTAGYDSITFSKPQMGNDVYVVYNGTTATVTIPSQLADAVTCSSGTSSNVVLTNTNTTDEVSYIVSGSSSAGSLTINADYKMTVKLNGVSLTSTTGAAIDIQCGKRIDIVMGDGTTNTLADYAGGTQKACLTTKGHVELSGAGTLNVSGNCNHAIRSKEYFQVKKSVGAINILKAANDAIHVGQYFQMNGGTITIDGNTLGDGVQVEYETDDNDVVVEDAENTASVFIKGGTINITVAGSEDTKGIKADGDVNISGGTITINASANGSRGIQLDGNMTVSEDDGTTAITITAAGKRCTLDEDAADPHRCMGIKVGDADLAFGGDLTVNGGTITVYNTGAKSKGIKVIGAYIVNGGTINAAVDSE